LRSVGRGARALTAARLVWRVAALPATRLLISLLLIGSIGASVVACRSGNGERLGERVIPLGQPVPKGGGTYVTGSAYQVDGVRYQPREDPTYDRVGMASWYGELFHGRRTANGEIYDMDRLSAASPTLPLPVYARVTNLQNNRSIIVRVNDRGPYANNRIMDLSRRSAALLGFRDNGTAPVRVQYLSRAPLNGDDSYELRYLASQAWAQVALRGGSSIGGAKEPFAVRSVAANVRPHVQPGYRSQGVVAAAPPLLPQVAAIRCGTETSLAGKRTRCRPLVTPIAASGPDITRSSGFLIQAGSFRSADNAERARSLLSGIAPVEVASTEVAGETMFRVRLGPFADETAANAALASVMEAGYRGAKIGAN
jgi:rare lipoprotein A